MTYQSLRKKYSALESEGDPDAENKLKFLTIANKVISDPNQRSLYDVRLACEAIPRQSAAIPIPPRSTIDTSPLSHLARYTLSIATIGACLILAGAFVPIVHFPMVGSINLIGGGHGVYGYLLIGMSLVSLYLIFIRQAYKWLVLPGLTAGLIAARTVIWLQVATSSMKAGDEGLVRAFSELFVATIQLQWGCAVLVIGAAMLMLSGIIRVSQEERSRYTSFLIAWRPQLIASVAAILLFAADFYLDGVPTRKNVQTQSAQDNEAERRASQQANISPKPKRSPPQESPSGATAVAIPPLKTRVTDITGTLTDGQLAGLEAKLWDFEKRKGSQVAVLIVPTTQPEAIEQYSIRVFDQWKLGRKGVDDGILLLVAKDDRKLRIEVGRDLEGVIPDAIAKRIIVEAIAPRFREGDFYGGTTAGVDRIMRSISK